jgi:hypothetical protein
VGLIPNKSAAPLLPDTRQPLCFKAAMMFSFSSCLNSLIVKNLDSGKVLVDFVLSLFSSVSV